LRSEVNIADCQYVCHNLLMTIAVVAMEGTRAHWLEIIGAEIHHSKDKI